MKDNDKSFLIALKQLEQNEAWQVFTKEINEEIINVRNLLAAEAVSANNSSTHLIRVFGGNLQTLVQVATWLERAKMVLEGESDDD